MQYDQINLKDKIITAARALFAANGVEHVSMRKIAEGIGYSPTTIYLYFKDKDDLLNYLVQEYYQNFIDKSQPILADISSDPLSALRRYLFLFVELGLQNPDYFQLMVTLFNGRKSHEEGRKHGLRVYGDLLSMVNTCMAQGVFPQSQADLTVQSLWSVLFGLTSLLISHPKFDWQDKNKLMEFTIDTHIAGLTGISK